MHKHLFHNNFWFDFGVNLALTSSQRKMNDFSGLSGSFVNLMDFLFLKVFFLVWTNTIFSSIMMMNAVHIFSDYFIRTYHIRLEIKLLLIWFSWLFLSSSKRKSRGVPSWVGLINRRCGDKIIFFQLSVLSCINFGDILKSSSSISSGFEFLKTRAYWHRNQTRYFPNWCYMTWIKNLTLRVFQFRFYFGNGFKLLYEIEFNDARLWAREFWHPIELRLLKTE